MQLFRSQNVYRGKPGPKRPSKVRMRNPVLLDFCGLYWTSTRLHLCCLSRPPCVCLSPPPQTLLCPPSRTLRVLHSPLPPITSSHACYLPFLLSSRSIYPEECRKIRKNSLKWFRPCAAAKYTVESGIVSGEGLSVLAVQGREKYGRGSPIALRFFAKQVR